MSGDSESPCPSRCPPVASPKLGLRVSLSRYPSLVSSLPVSGCLSRSVSAGLSGCLCLCRSAGLLSAPWTQALSGWLQVSFRVTHSSSGSPRSLPCTEALFPAPRLPPVKSFPRTRRMTTLHCTFERAAPAPPHRPAPLVGHTTRTARCPAGAGGPAARANPSSGWARKSGQTEPDPQLAPARTGSVPGPPLGTAAVPCSDWVEGAVRRAHRADSEDLSRVPSATPEAAGPERGPSPDSEEAPVRVPSRLGRSRWPGRSRCQPVSAWAVPVCAQRLRLGFSLVQPFVIAAFADADPTG